MNNGILALAYEYRTELSAIAPIARHLERSGTPCHFLIPPILSRLAQKEALSYETFRPEAGEHAKYLAHCKTWIDTFLSTLAHSEIKTRAGLPVKLFPSWFRRRLTEKNLADAISYYLRARELIAETSPKAVLLVNSWSAQGTLARLAAAESGVKTIVIPTYFTQLSFLSRELLSEFTGHFPDCWGVLGERMVKVLSDLGVERRSIRTINFPKFNVRKVPTARGSQILLILQNFPEDNRVIGQTLEALRDCPQCTLVIRPHPIARPSFGVWQSLHITMNGRIRIDAHTPLESLLEESAIVVSVSSIGCYEAILRDRPVVMLNTVNRPASYLFKEYGSVIELTDPRLLSSTIKDILQEQTVQAQLAKGRENIINDFVPRERGNVVDVVNDLLTDRDETITPLASSAS